MKTTIAAVLMLSVALCAAPAFASDVQVIGNASVPAELTAADLKEIFLGNKTAAGGGPVVPVLSSGAAHDAFLKAYVGKTDQGLKTHFKSLVFTGQGSMPKSLASDADVVKYVSATKGAVGYVSASADVAGAKKIAVK